MKKAEAVGAGDEKTKDDYEDAPRTADGSPDGSPEEGSGVAPGDVANNRLNAKDSPVGVSTSPKAPSPAGSGTPEDDEYIPIGKVPSQKQMSGAKHTSDPSSIDGSGSGSGTKKMQSTSVEALVADLDEGMPQLMHKPLHEQKELQAALMVEDSLVVQSEEERKMMNLLSGGGANGEDEALDPIDDLS